MNINQLLDNYFYITHIKNMTSIISNIHYLKCVREKYAQLILKHSFKINCNIGFFVACIL